MPRLPNAVDPSRGLPRTLTMPERWVPVSPSDVNYLEGDSSGFNVAVAIYCGAAGNLSYIDIYGTTTIIPVVAGVILPGSFVRILSTNTTATGIVAGFIGEAL